MVGNGSGGGADGGRCRDCRVDRRRPGERGHQADGNRRPLGRNGSAACNGPADWHCPGTNGPAWRVWPVAGTRRIAARRPAELDLLFALNDNTSLDSYRQHLDARRVEAEDELDATREEDPDDDE